MGVLGDPEKLSAARTKLKLHHWGVEAHSELSPALSLDQLQCLIMNLNSLQVHFLVVASKSNHVHLVRADSCGVCFEIERFPSFVDVLRLRLEYLKHRVIGRSQDLTTQLRGDW